MSPLRKAIERRVAVPLVERVSPWKIGVVRAYSVLWIAACLWALAACNNGGESAGNGGPVMLQERPPETAEMVDDTILPSRIKQALAADSRIDAAAVSISVNKGQVTLDGTVPAEQITRIDAIVRDVAGVKEVINALRSTKTAP